MMNKKWKLGEMSKWFLLAILKDFTMAQISSSIVPHSAIYFVSVTGLNVYASSEGEKHTNVKEP